MRRPPPPALFPSPTLFRSISASTSASAALRRLPCSTTCAPAAARRCAMARPIPRDDPVTSATRPDRSISIDMLGYQLDALDRKSTRLNSSHVSISYAVFCLNDATPTATCPLSLPDALPIYLRLDLGQRRAAPAAMQHDMRPGGGQAMRDGTTDPAGRSGDERHPARQVDLNRHAWIPARRSRSEEHTSELQSRFDLVCRLLLERCDAHRHLPSFPPRRSSDLSPPRPRPAPRCAGCHAARHAPRRRPGDARWHDRSRGTIR